MAKMVCENFTRDKNLFIVLTVSSLKYGAKIEKAHENQSMGFLKVAKLATFLTQNLILLSHFDFRSTCSFCIRVCIYSTCQINECLRRVSVSCKGNFLVTLSFFVF